MNYCNQKGIGCEYANINGNCSVTGCMNHQNQTIIIETHNNCEPYHYYNNCEICGQPTEDIYHHICAKCRLKLHDILYNDKNWGIG